MRARENVERELDGTPDWFLREAQVSNYLAVATVFLHVVLDAELTNSAAPRQGLREPHVVVVEHDEVFYRESPDDLSAVGHDVVLDLVLRVHAPFLLAEAAVFSKGREVEDCAAEAEFVAAGELVHLHDHFVVERSASRGLLFELLLLAQKDGGVGVVVGVPGFDATRFSVMAVDYSKVTFDGADEDFDALNGEST